MIDQKYSRVFRTEHRPVETGAIFVDEGISAVFVKEGDTTVVVPSTGADGEIFAGLSLSRNTPPQFANLVVEDVVPVTGPYVTVLPRIPETGQILVKVNGVKLNVVATPPNAGEVQLSGFNLTYHSDVAGGAVVVQFQYALTVAEATMFRGNAPVGGLSSSAEGVIGLVVEGDVATSYYDASADWSGVFNPVLGPNGVLTTSGPGTVLKNVIVESAPSAANPSLVVTLR